MRQSKLLKFAVNFVSVLFLVCLSVVAVKIYAAYDNKVALSDLQWMEQAARASAAEVQAAELAAQQAQTPEVRSFGRRLAEHHGRAGEELMALARARGVQLPDQPDNAHRKLLKSLAGLPGESFDEEYVKHAGARDHQETAKLFEEGIGHLKDPALQAYALNTLPMIQRDYQDSRDLKQVL